MYGVTFLLSLFGVDALFWAEPSTLGIVVSVGICIVAALNLFLDFDMIRRLSVAGAPKPMEWYGAFGLTVTLVLAVLRDPAPAQRTCGTERVARSADPGHLESTAHGRRRPHRRSCCASRPGAPRSRGVRPRREARLVRLAGPRRRRVRRHAPRPGRDPGRRRVPAAAVVDQVRDLLPGRAARRCDHVGDQPAARPGREGEHPRAHQPRRDGRRRRRRARRRRGRRPPDPRLRARSRVRRRAAAVAAGAVADRRRVHRVDERDDRAAEGRGVRPHRAWRSSRATSASSPRPGDRRLSRCRSRTSDT